MTCWVSSCDSVVAVARSVEYGGMGQDAKWVKLAGREEPLSDRRATREFKGGSLWILSRRESCSSIPFFLLRQ